MSDLEARVARKLRRRILPFVMLLYFISFLDRVNVGFAAFTMNKAIGLTPSMAGQLFAAFGDEVALLHSQLTPDERAEQWHRIRRGEAGHYHHIAGPYLARYAQESAWREDHRRTDNGTQVNPCLAPTQINPLLSASCPASAARVALHSRHVGFRP